MMTTCILYLCLLISLYVGHPPNGAIASGVRYAGQVTVTTGPGAVIFYTFLGNGNISVPFSIPVNILVVGGGGGGGSYAADEVGIKQSKTAGGLTRRRRAYFMALWASHVYVS